MNIENLRIADLTPDPQNARQHDDKNLKAIMGSLKEFGQRKPIVITEAGVIVAGNGTVEAAKRLGWLEIEVVRVPSDWTDAQVKAFAIADNRTAELANWNQEVLTSQLLELEAEGWELAEFGFEAFELPDEDKPVIEDEIPESAPGRVALGDIWQLGNHRLGCLDATSESSLECLVLEQVDMIYTDPPYGIEHSGKGITGDAKGNDFGEILGDSDLSAAKDVYQITKDKYPKASHVFWGANYFASAVDDGYGWIVWDKQREGETFSGAELAFVNKGVKVNVFRHQWHGMIKASERGQSRVHPTQKPIALASWVFDNYGKPKTVLDFFGGSGSTLIACEQTNRTCYMMELDPKYCDVIIERWEKLTGQKAELLPAKAD
jgi:site-specific DNA-methyltransferase (adenine-specific)